MYFDDTGNVESSSVAKALGALSHETRLVVYRLLVQQGSNGMAAGRIGAALMLPPATLSFHLRELTQSGLVQARQQSRFIYYRADLGAMDALLTYLAEHCGITAIRAAERAGDSASGELARAPPPAIKPVIRPKRRSA